MKCVLLLLSLAAVTAAEDRKSSDPQGYSYYVSNWPSGFDVKKAPRKDQASELRKDYSPIAESRSDGYYKDDSHDDYGYGYGYGPNDDYPKVIGRHGFGFEKRIARATGLRQPITPEALEHVGKRLTFKELKYVPLVY